MSVLTFLQHSTLVSLAKEQEKDGSLQDSDNLLQHWIQPIRKVMKKDLSLKVTGVNSSPKLNQTVISGFTEVNVAFELDYYFAPSLSSNRT